MVPADRGGMDPWAGHCRGVKMEQVESVSLFMFQGLYDRYENSPRAITTCSKRINVWCCTQWLRVKCVIVF